MEQTWTRWPIERAVAVTHLISAFERDLDSNRDCLLDAHDFWEFLYVQEGEVLVQDGERLLSLHKHDIVFHKPMNAHRFVAQVPSRILVVALALSGDTAFFEELSGHVPSLPREQIAEILRLIRSERRVAREPADRWFAGFAEHPRAMQELADRLELFLLSLPEHRLPSVRDSDSPELSVFKHALEVMEQNLYGWITVADLAAQLGVSASYLKTVFKKQTTMGVHRYFLKSKLLLAERLLLEGNSVVAVAERLSFSSANYFTTVFKRQTGMTPTAFKAKKR